MGVERSIVRQSIESIGGDDGATDCLLTALGFRCLIRWKARQGKVSFKKYVKPWGLGHGPYVLGSRLFRYMYKGEVPYIFYVHSEPQWGRPTATALLCA